jgi:hypothetical protein
MGIGMSLKEQRLGVNQVLTNLAQGFYQPEFVMRILYPFVAVPGFSGVAPRHDESAYEDVDDTRALDGFYKSVQRSIRTGEPYVLDIRGLSVRVADEEAREAERGGTDWIGEAPTTLMEKFNLRHEIECALRATAIAAYHPNNRIVLTPEQNFRNALVEPDGYIFDAIDAVALAIGAEPNVMVMGREVYSALARNRKFRTAIGAPGGSAGSDLLEAIKAYFKIDAVKLCTAIQRRGGSKYRVFGKSIVIARTNPLALQTPNTTVIQSFAPDRRLKTKTPSYGYTLVYQESANVSHPVVRDPYYDQDRSATVIKGDFDRKVAQTGVDDTNLITHGFLIANAA